MSAAVLDTPVPFSRTYVGLPVEELLVTANCPLVLPADVGSNWTVTVVDWPELRVTGRFALEIEKPLPVALALLMVSGALPVDLRITD